MFKTCRNSIREKRKKYFIGIDPGLKYTGVAIIDEYKNIIDFNKINSEKIVKLGEEIEKILKKYKPELTAIEKVFTKINPRDAIKLGEYKGVIIYLLEKNKLRYIETLSSNWKKAITGSGRAKNYQVEFMIKNLLKGNFKEKISEHEVDALSLAYFALSRCITE
ncbi:MAG: crossover junction endodeoxyribonuclease RuvC [candidate division WOR-3 bacterium]